jgi:alkylhydroperoxidase family enzyme
MHAAVAAKALTDVTLTERVLDDYTKAPVSESLRATLGFLKKVTLEPDEVTPQDVRDVMNHGVSRAQVRDALYICYLFNVYDRLADTLDWAIPERGAVEAGAQNLLKRGYRA